MSRRKLTFLRKLLYLAAGTFISLWVRLVWLSSKVTIHHKDRLVASVKEKGTIVPCFWHNQLFICAYFVTRFKHLGLKPGFLISPSVDGELGVNVVSNWGAEVIRGSSTRTGAQAMRELYMAVKQRSISPATTPDGPKGPVYKAKPGVIMLSQSTGAPIIPIACNYQRAWTFNSWDKLQFPKLFNRITISVGLPIVIKKSPKTKEEIQQDLEKALNQLTLECGSSLS